MTIDNSFMIKRLEGFETLFVLFSAATHSPFVECDEDTMDDQVYVCTSEEGAKECAERYRADKLAVQPARLPGKAAKAFFTSLYLFGVTAVILRDEGAPVRIALDQLAKSPDLEKMKQAKVPGANPELQLTGMYFMQELSRPVERNAEEKKHLRELEEEMAHNLLHARLIISVDVSAVKGPWNPADPEQRKLVRVPMIRHKNGKNYQPVYTDISEFQKFNQNNKNAKLQVLVVTYDRLAGLLVKEAEGVAFNPGGFNLVLNRAQMQQMAKRYGEQG